MSRMNGRNTHPCTCTVKGDYSDDLAAVSALPDQWVPRPCGPILTNYLIEREQNHEKVLVDLMKEAEKVNKDIDARIRVIAEILLCHMQQNPNDMDCVIQKIKQSEEVLSLEAKNETFKEITTLFTSRLQDLTKFKQEALELERERADGIRNVLKSKFHRLVAIGHKTPKDLLHDFDDRIYGINQQLISNCRAYIELEDQLRANLDESIVHARSKLNQLCLQQSTGTIVEGKSDLNCTGDFSQGVTVDIEEFNLRVFQLLETYHDAILKVFAGFSIHLHDLHKNIGFDNLNNSSRSSTVVLDMENMIDYALQRISNSNIQVKGAICKDLKEMTRNHVQHMQQSLSTLGKCLSETYMTLFHATHLFDAHILRTALVQKLTVAAVENIQNVHDTTVLANEVNFNIALEQMRCASDIDKMQQNFDVTMNSLKTIGELSLLHSESEVAKLEEYMNLRLVMANVLLAECDVFFKKHPRIIIQPPGSLIIADDGTPISKSVYSQRAPLPRAFLQTDLQVQALSHWKNGFLESFESNLATLSEGLDRQARKWVDERSVQLNMRRSMKHMSHGIRGERVTSAREARIKELRFHEERLNSHLDAMNDRIENLPNVSSFLALDAPELYPFCKWIKDIKTNMDDLLSRNPDPEMKRLKMFSYALRLVKHRQHFEESLNSAIDEYRKVLEHDIQVARTSNFLFVCQLKLFIEGGRFAAAEATKTCAALAKAADALEVCEHRCMEALNGRRSQLLALADQHILPLQRVVEEVYKPLKHNEKKKPAPNKIK